MDLLILKLNYEPDGDSLADGKPSLVTKRLQSYVKNQR